MSSLNGRLLPAPVRNALIAAGGQGWDILWHVVIFLACWLFYTSNPLGLKAATESASADWINLAYAKIYDGSRRDDIVVILATDRDVDQFNDSFPLSYHLQQTVLERIASFKPKAVFIDYVFSRPHPASESYDAAQFATFLKSYPVPLFLARGDASPERPAGVLPEFDVTTLVSVPKFLNPSMRSAYCFYYPPQTGDLDRGKCAAAGAPLTAAAAMYTRLCVRGDDPRCPQTGGDMRPFRGDYMRVMWGGPPSPLFDFLPGRSPCRLVKWHELINPDRDAILADCAYHPQMTISELWPEGDAAMKARLANALRDKIVMYGGFFGPNHDIVRPPTAPGVAGVHLHAMALDNLLTLGRDYKADVGRIGSYTIEKSTVDAIFFSIAYVIVLIRKVVTDMARDAWTRPRIIATVGSVAIYPAFCAFSFFALDMAPINWVGAAFTTVILPTAFRAFLAKVKTFYYSTFGATTGVTP